LVDIPGTETIVAIFFFIIPGFITYIVKDSLVKFEKPSELDKIIEILIYSFFIYTLLSFWDIKVFQIVSFDEITIIQPRSSVLIGIWFISILMGGIIAYISKENWYYNVSSRFGFGTKSGRPNVWDEIFKPDDKNYIWVRIHKNDGSVIEGNLIFSSDFEDKELYLEDVYVTDQRGNEIQTHYDGIYIHDKDIRYIEISRQKNN